MDQKELLKKMKALNSAIEDYIDNLDMGDTEEDKPKKEKPACKESKEGKEE